MASQRPETLTDLLRERVSVPGGLTFRQLYDRALDPDEHYRPSTRILHNLREGGNVRLNPKLLRALAAGLGLPLERVQRAAFNQFILGVDLVEPAAEQDPADTAVRVAKIRGEELDPRAQAQLDRMLAEAREREEDNNNQ